MLIKDIFATTIQERIEPVVKVADRSPTVLLNELQNLVVTPQWEKYLHHILEAYTDAFDRNDEQGIGIWISGFFGSGKSLMMKVLGILLEGGEFWGKLSTRYFLAACQATAENEPTWSVFWRSASAKFLLRSLVGTSMHNCRAAMIRWR